MRYSFLTILTLLLAFGSFAIESKSNDYRPYTFITPSQYKVQVYFEKALENIDQENIEMGESLISKGIELANGTNYIYGQKMGVLVSAILAAKRGNHEYAVDKYIELMHSSPKLIGTDEAVLLIGIAESLSRLGADELAIEYREKCLLIEGVPLLKRYYNLTTLSSVFRDIGDVDKSNFYHQKSLVLAYEIDEQHVFLHAYNEIGFSYYEQGQLNKSLEYYWKGIRTFHSYSEHEESDRIMLAMIYRDLSHIQKKQGEYKEAIESLAFSTELFKKLGNKFLSRNYILNSEAQIAIKDYSGAKSSLDTAGIFLENFSDKMHYYEVLSTYYTSTGQIQQANKALRKNIELKNEKNIQNAPNYKILEIIDLQSKQIQEKLRLQEELMEREHRISGMEFRAISIASGMIFLVLIILFFIYKQGRRKKEQLAEAKNLLIEERLKVKEDEQFRLVEAKEIAEKAVETRTQFLSTMSHELRTPLNGIIGITEILKFSDPRKDQINNLDALHYSGKSLLVLINDILDFTKMEEGRMELQKLNVDLTKMSESIVKIHQASCKYKLLPIGLKVDSDLPVILSDPTRISQVLNNLLSNAVKFTDRGAVELFIKKISEDETHCDVLFEVCDSGIGIPKDKIDLIFDSYTQVESESGKNYGGTGLGLSITKKIVDLLGSQIHVKSTLGEGSVFYFTVKFEKDKIRKLESVNPKEEVFKFNNEPILYAEDNEINVIVAVQLFERWGLDVTVVGNGEEAIDRLNQDEFKLILMDCQMPEMDGFEATRIIRESNLDIPIVALTASSLVSDQKKILDCGMNDFALKPIDQRKLNLMIGQFLGYGA